MSGHPFETDLDRNPANYTPLTPLSFIARTAAVFPDRLAVIHGDQRFSWRETDARCRRLASALAQNGIGRGDTVAVLAPNVPPSFEATFGVPMAGAVLNAINTRLDAAVIAFILDHGEAKALIVDTEFAPVAKDALARLGKEILVIDYADPTLDGSGDTASGGERIGAIDYEAFLASGDPEFTPRPPEDEWEALALNYTSGTTGNPKGVVYHHRGAYLNAMANALVWGMKKHPVYLWTLPMFHCNGWCFPWTITVMGGTHVCLRGVEAKPIYDAIADHGVTHMCGAPVVMNMLANAPEEVVRTPNQGQGQSHHLDMMTAGSAPPAAVIEAMEARGITVTHTYGLTEVYGPVTVCEWHDEWDALPVSDRADLKARQGVRYPVLEGLMVADPETLEPVPADGKTMGEVLMRGNVVMKGYLKNIAASEEAFRGGWFHSGDLGVLHPSGYIELKDRSKDIIISGGENISTIEVEGVLFRHPAILEAAVVARPDEKWGETPCAFVTLRPGETAGETVDESGIIAWCRDNLAHFKAPKTVIFGDLPKTSTGKIQKFALRDRIKTL